MHPRLFASIVVLLATRLSLTADPALSRLYSFGQGGAAAANPNARLLQASDGVLYGTTSAGGQSGNGTIFKINGDGSGFALLKSFDNSGVDGQRPFAALMEGSDGMFYGTTEGGGQFGSGTVFRLKKDGSGFEVLKSFSGVPDGAYPDASILEGTDGLLYGTTSGGGTNDNGGVFRMSKDGSGFTPLIQFDGTNGANPECELIEASDGLLYGATASSRTTTNAGTIFRLQKDGGGFVVLDRFITTASIKTNGAAPLSRLVEGTNGVLFGTTSAGGTKGMGTIYRLNKDGSGFAMIYHFGTNSLQDGRYPLGELLLAGDGMLYGTTYDAGTNGNGTIFRIAQDGTGYTGITTLVSAQSPAAGLIEATNGMLYGTTQLGGVSADGTLFGIQKDGSSFTILKNFSSTGDDGRSPQSAPIVAETNLLYGTTRLGGGFGGGTIYRLRFDGVGYESITALGSSGGPSDLFGSLLELTNETLAGVSRFGGDSGAGAIFSIDEAGANLGILHSLVAGDGSEVRARLIQGSDGMLYGTAMLGGASAEGAVFRLNADGSGYTIIKSFQLRVAGSAANPAERLLEGSDGNLYGTTYFGGTTNRGVVFMLSKDGSTYAVLKNFGTPATDGETPLSPLLEGSDGTLYGSTYGGGSTNNGGTIFRMNKDGSAFQVILAFAASNADARHPRGEMVEWTDGAIYGTTERGGAADNGALFRVNKDGSGYAVLASFDGLLGISPRGGLVQGPDGALYGSTDQGGDMGLGTVFRYGPAFGDLIDLQVANQVPTVTAIGQPGTNYVLEHTLQLGPLASWSPVLSTNAPVTGRFRVIDQSASAGGAPQSFYRLRW